jgi:hypothetical protein
MVGLVMRYRLVSHKSLRRRPNVATLDAADAKEAVDPVGGFRGDDGVPL